MQLVLDGVLVGVYKQDETKRSAEARAGFVRLVFNGIVYAREFTPTSIMPVTQYTLLDWAPVTSLDEQFAVWQENFGCNMRIDFDLSWVKPKDGYYSYRERILNWRLI